MRKLLNLLYIIALSVLLNSCFKEDQLYVLPAHTGNTKLAVIEMTETFKNQVFFSLDSAKALKFSLKTAWDLAFENGSGSHILLNSSKFMKVFHTGKTDFKSVTDTIGAKWKYDLSNGKLDSTAIGNWVDLSGSLPVYSNEIIIIDRGYDELGNLTGLKKIVFQYVNDSSYTFRFADLNGKNEKVFTLLKETSTNFTSFSFNNGGNHFPFEPDKNKWDLLFTQYSTVLFTDAGEPYPYVVTGALINRNNMEVAVDSSTDFSVISFGDIARYHYSKNVDYIGYDWKKYDFGTTTYVVKSKKVYIIKAVSGYYYKLRFTAFYNKLGQKGYPAFEFQRL